MGPGAYLDTSGDRSVSSTCRETNHNSLLSNNPICTKCGTEEETSAHIPCEYEALATLRHSLHIWVPSFWTRRTSGYWVWGPSGTLLKKQGSYYLVQNTGHKGPVLRPRCIGLGRARNQHYSILFYSILTTIPYSLYRLSHPGSSQLKAHFSNCRFDRAQKNFTAVLKCACPVTPVVKRSVSRNPSRFSFRRPTNSVGINSRSAIQGIQPFHHIEIFQRPDKNKDIIFFL